MTSNTKGSRSPKRSRSTNRSKPDPARERRIEDEIIVDAYGPDEQAMGWYYYLEMTLAFPFTARCVKLREVSPLEVGDEVEVIGMPKEVECGAEMFVKIRWGKRGLAVPLIQLQPHPRKSNTATRQAVADWHYWVGMGHQFC
ncbi:MAG: calcium-binding protein [Phycisphaerales bacterium]|nr:calcium-binding protein [Phycisphaerales bacterium]